MYKDARLVLEKLSCNDTLSVSGLKLLLKGKNINVVDAAVYLKEQGLLRIEPEYDILHAEELSGCICESAPLQITFEGKVALNQAHEDVRQHYFNEVRAWVTLALAVIANIIAIVAILIP